MLTGQDRRALWPGAVIRCRQLLIASMAVCIQVVAQSLPNASIVLHIFLSGLLIGSSDRRVATVPAVRALES